MAIERDQAACLIESLVSLLRTSRIVVQRTSEQSVSGTPIVLLRLVREADLRLRDLAEHLSVTPSSASRAVAALEQQGYVERVADPDDARACRVRLTAAGMEYLRVREEATFQRLEDVFADWTAEEARDSVRVLQRLQRSIRQFVGDPEHSSAHDESTHPPVRPWPDTQTRHTTGVETTV